MTKKKSAGEIAKEAEDFYRVWFEYLKESEGYRRYCHAKREGLKSHEILRKVFGMEDHDRFVRFDEIYELFGDYERDFEEVRKGLSDVLDAPPVTDATVEICSLLFHHIKGRELLGRPIPDCETLLTGKTQGAKVPDIVKHFQDIPDDNGYFLLKVTPGVHDIETLKEAFGEVVQAKLKTWRENPPKIPSPLNIIHLSENPPRKRIEEWRKYLRVLRARENEKLPFREIAEREAGLGTWGKDRQIDDRKLKQVNQWHKRGLEILSKVDQGFPVGTGVALHKVL
jgi:hypothetical protein